MKEEKTDFFLNNSKFSNIALSPIISFNSWNDLINIRNKSFNNHIEGIMLKNKNSIYKKGRPKGPGINGREILLSLILFLCMHKGSW